MSDLIKYASALKNSFLKRYRLQEYRKKAHSIRRKVIEKTGREIVTKQLKEEIKEYSNEMFGSPSFWPWLAVYSEIKGEFIPGWLPYDYFQIILLDKWNPNKFSEISNMKTFYHSYFDDFIVKPLAVKVSGVYYDQNWNIIPNSKLVDMLQSSFTEIVVKKDGGFGGKDIRFLQTKDLNIRELENDKENLVVQPAIQQHPVIAEFHSQSLNTLRIATFLETDGSVSLKFVTCRFGTGGNRIDNVSAGGRHCFLNIEGEPVTGALNLIGLNVDHENHTLAKVLKALIVPSVENAVKKCIQHHSLFPYVRYIAWDVCIDLDSKPKMIEWNAVRPNMWEAEPYVGPIWDLDSILNEK